MFVLTDSRELADPLLAEMTRLPAGPHESASAGPPGPVFREPWRSLRPVDLLPAEQALWIGLGNGDRLALCEIELEPGLDGWDYLVIIDVATGSQYDALRRMDPRRLPGSIASVAATGSGFHGHHERAWQTRRGNLHLCLQRDPDLDAAECGLAMTALPAVALVDVLEATGPWCGPPGIKWVNDILIDDRKVAGVLTATQSLRGRLTGLTLGLGLNIKATPVLPTGPFVHAAGCLAESPGSEREEAQPPALGEMLAHCLRAISTRLRDVHRHGPRPLIDAYRNRSLVVGRQVAIWPDNAAPGADAADEPMALGVVESIGPDLSLTLADHDEPIRCGRLALLPERSV